MHLSVALGRKLSGEYEVKKNVFDLGAEWPDSISTATKNLHDSVLLLLCTRIVILVKNVSISFGPFHWWNYVFWLFKGIKTDPVDNIHFKQELVY